MLLLNMTACGQAPDARIAALDPTTWKQPTAMRSPATIDAVQRLREALLTAEPVGVRKATRALHDSLGAELSLPEVKPDYVGPISRAEPARAALLQRWLDDCARRLGKDPWDRALAAQAAGRVPNRLRDSERMAMAYLATARLLEAEAAAKFQARAFTGLRYIRSCQSSEGVFGYPYDPARSDRLGLMATAMVEKGRKLGRPMVEGTWIIDDLGEGDLQFDNGICGLAMIAAYELSGDEGFLESARRAAEWAITRPLVPNWNYNAFSARLLARLYVTTRDSRYLEEARRKFQLGVLPGQTETGRWLDPHNARTPYHAILATALVDYVEALELAVAPDAADVRSALVLALDNLALQTIAYGASNVHELLPLEAFYRGVKLGGARSDWCDAVKVNLNVLTPELCARFARELGHLPETLPYGILALDHDR